MVISPEHNPGKLRHLLDIALLSLSSLEERLYHFIAGLLLLFHLLVSFSQLPCSSFFSPRSLGSTCLHRNLHFSCFVLLASRLSCFSSCLACDTNAVQKAFHSTWSKAFERSKLTSQRGVPTVVSKMQFAVTKWSSIHQFLRNSCCSSGWALTKNFQCGQAQRKQTIYLGLGTPRVL